MYILDKEMSKTESREMLINYLLYLVVVAEAKWFPGMVYKILQQ